MSTPVSPVSEPKRVDLFRAPHRMNGKANVIYAMIWDIGNVLARYYHRRACEKLAEHSPFSAEQIHTMLFIENRELIDGHLTGKVSSDRFFAIVCQLIGVKNTLSLREFHDIWGNIFEENTLAHSIIARLRKGIHQCILSDTDPIHWSWMERLGIIKTHFPDANLIVRSFRIGVRKPNKVMYLAALACLGLSEEESYRVLYVDDKIENCEAFRQMGGKALHYDCSQHPIRVLEEGLKSFGVLRPPPGIGNERLTLS